jgi:hypothetical protein
MAERVTRKGKRPAPPPRQRSGRAAPADPKRDAQGRLEALERERDQLKVQLSDAQASIIRLEQARDAAVNRIDWAIDSLHNVLEGDA